MEFLPLLVLFGVIYLLFTSAGTSTARNNSAQTNIDQSHQPPLLDDDSSMKSDELFEDSPARGLWDPTSIYYDHTSQD